jgi:hypothetical protein
LPRSRLLPALAAALALALPAAPGAAPRPAAEERRASASPLAPLLARTFKLYGGLEAILRVGALRLTGRVVDGVTAPGAAPRFERLLALPDGYRSAVTMGGLEHETLVLSGQRAFRDGAEVTGLPRADLIRLEAARTFLPAELARRRAALVDRGEVRRGSRWVRLVELPLNPHASLTAELDPESGAILRSVSRASGRETAVSFSRLRPVGGLLFPFSEELEGRGPRRRTLVVDQVDLLPAASVRIPGP